MSNLCHYWIFTITTEKIYLSHIYVEQALLLRHDDMRCNCAATLSAIQIVRATRWLRLCSDGSAPRLWLTCAWSVSVGKGSTWLPQAAQAPTSKPTLAAGAAARRAKASKIARPAVGSPDGDHSAVMTALCRDPGRACFHERQGMVAPIFAVHPVRPTRPHLLPRYEIDADEDVAVRINCSQRQPRVVEA